MTTLWIFKRTQKVFLQKNTLLGLHFLRCRQWHSFQGSTKKASMKTTQGENMDWQSAGKVLAWSTASLGFISERKAAQIWTGLEPQPPGPGLVTVQASRNCLLAHTLNFKKKCNTTYSYSTFPYFLQSYNALNIVCKHNPLTLYPGLQNQ